MFRAGSDTMTHRLVLQRSRGRHGSIIRLKEMSCV